MQLKIDDMSVDSNLILKGSVNGVRITGKVPREQKWLLGFTVKATTLKLTDQTGVMVCLCIVWDMLSFLS